MSYDTVDRRLARWGCSLRRRVGEGWIVEIPQPTSGIILARQEVIITDAGGEPPIRALNLVGSLTRGAAVEAVPNDAAAIGPPDVVVRPLRSDPLAREVVIATLASSTARLMLLLPAAHLGTDPEGVHQARVASRRLRSDLSTFKPLLDDEWSAELREELRWLIDELGAVRDNDVLVMKLRDVLDRHPEIDREAGLAVLHQLALKHLSDRCLLLRHLGEERALRLLDHLVEASSSPATQQRADRPANEVLPRLVRKRWRRLDLAVEQLGPGPTPVQLHQLRILAKRLRYAAEAVAPTVGKQADKFARQAAKIQDALGELNDAAVGAAWMASIVGDLDGPAAFATGQMAQQLIVDAGTHESQWRSAHRALARRTDWFC